MLLKSRLQPIVHTGAVKILFKGLIIFGFVALPLFVTGYLLHVTTLALIYLILVQGTHWLSGVSGQVSFGQPAFMGAGAYAGVVLLVRHDLPFLAAVFVAIVAACALALLVGPALARLTGDYFVIGTIALLMICYLILLNAVDVTGGPMGISGIPRPKFGGFEFGTTVSMYYLCLVINVVAYILLTNLEASRIGRAMRVMRDDDIAAQSFGVPLIRFRVLAMVLSAGLAGLSGILFAAFASYLNPQSFDYTQGVMFAIIIIIGGLGSMHGAILATFLITFSPELLREVGDYRLVIYGLVLVIMMIFRPQGLLGVRRD